MTQQTSTQHIGAFLGEGENLYCHYISLFCFYFVVYGDFIPAAYQTLEMKTRSCLFYM